MIARINFDTNQRITMEELKILAVDMADEIQFAPLYKDSKGEFTLFYTYCHTLNPEEVVEGNSKKKELVKITDWIELDTKKEYLVDLDLFFTKPPNLKVRMRGNIRTMTTNFSGVIEQLDFIQDKFENALKKFDRSVEFNEKCEVHVSNLSLLTINQIAYAEDKCTEELQDLLNVGWRFLAICPQPDQRRPDYILGRYNPNPDNEKLECKKF